MTFLKRSLSLKGHRTSLALEPDFWTELDRIAEDRSLSLPRSSA
ncbi:ribbon-helix-helix domain-containing protein [Pannonibacter phragmitetus]